MNLNNHKLPELINLLKQHYNLIELNIEEMINNHRYNKEIYLNKNKILKNLTAIIYKIIKQKIYNRKLNLKLHRYLRNQLLIKPQK